MNAFRWVAWFMTLSAQFIQDHAIRMVYESDATRKPLAIVDPLWRHEKDLMNRIEAYDEFARVVRP